MTAAGTLFTLGFLLEIIGRLLVTTSDWWPPASELVAATRKRLTRWWLRILRFFGHRRSVTHTAGVGGAIASGGRVSTVVSKGESATLEEKVSFLLQEATRTQERLNKLEALVADQPAAWRRDITEARRDLEHRIEARLTETQDRYLGARRAGLACLLLGIALLAASAVVAG
jgi:hypothetical protein